MSFYNFLLHFVAKCRMEGGRNFSLEKTRLALPLGSIDIIKSEMDLRLFTDNENKCVGEVSGKIFGIEIIPNWDYSIVFFTLDLSFVKRYELLGSEINKYCEEFALKKQKELKLSIEMNKAGKEKKK